MCLPVVDSSLPESLKHIVSNAEYYGPSIYLPGGCGYKMGVADGRLGIVWYLQSVRMMATVLVVINNATLTGYH